MLLSRRFLSVMPAAWLASGCFLGGDYFTEQELLPAPSSSATESDSEHSSNVHPQPFPTEPPQLTSTPDERSQTASTSEDTGEDTSPGKAITSPSSEPSGTEATSGDTPSTAPSGIDTSSFVDPSSSDVDTSNSTIGETCPNGAECTVSNCDSNDGEVSGPGGRCYWVSPTTMNWNAAQNECKKRGRGWGQVSPRNESEDTFIASLLTVQTWLGAQNTGGLWRWMDDSSVFYSQSPLNPRDAYTNWGTNEPSNAIGETCARYHLYNDVWRWSDAKCGGPHAAACQGPLPQ